MALIATDAAAILAALARTGREVLLHLAAKVALAPARRRHLTQLRALAVPGLTRRPRPGAPGPVEAPTETTSAELSTALIQN